MLILFYIFSHENHFSEYEVSERLSRGYFEEEAQEVAGRIAALVKKAVPKHLLGEWWFSSALAGMPLV